MESLRWILLTAGVLFVLVIYMLGRSRKRRNQSIVDSLEEGQDDLPEFSANKLDDVDEGVGEVRVVSGAGPVGAGLAGAGLKEDIENFSSSDNENPPVNNNLPSDIIVLFILPKPKKELLGSQINSSAQAMGLKFGEMNVFHYSTNGRSVFSLANMLEPGSFDAATIHEIKTTGLTVFMQMAEGDPLDDLTEMLQRSYQLAGLLDARLCNHKREPLTEQDAENYREQVRAFSEDTTPELSTET